jgi:predicted MPP superfamily phosphohydrolase
MFFRRMRPTLRLSAGALASSSLWFFLMNRFIIHWVDCPLKTAVIVLVAAALGLAGVLPAMLAWPGPWGRGSVVVLALFALGEGRRAWLRHEYQASDASAPPDLLHPVTTTDLRVHHFTVAVPELGRARLRAVHLTDLHISQNLPEAYFQQIHEAIRAASPDLVVMTGDYLSQADRLPRLAAWLEGLPPTRFGTYAVLGNHDYWVGLPAEIREAMSRAGVHMIGGSCESIAIDDRSVRVCGTEAPWGPGFDAGAAGSDAAATLVLSHTPDNVYDLAARRVTAVFAGHTHGGQFRVPGIGALLIPSRFGRRFDRGHFDVDGTHLFVSAGVGADAPPLRLWCPPELFVVDLVGRAEG